VNEAWKQYVKPAKKREDRPQPVSPEREEEITRELARQFQDKYESR